MVYLKQFIDAIAFLSEFEPEHSISDAKRNEIYKYFKNKSSDLELQKAELKRKKHHSKAVVLFISLFNLAANLLSCFSVKHPFNNLPAYR